MKTIEQNIIKFIDRNELISVGDKILVALSGGADSVFLVYFLYKYQQRFKVTIAAYHVNHMFRGDESDGDEKFCKELCQKFDIHFFSKKVNVQNIANTRKVSFEEAARDVRYSYFDELSKTEGFTKIAIAHNQNDNTETVLLNLSKGTGLSGISGIPLQRGKIIRPLLNTTKEEILEYLKKGKISFRIDRTNLEDDYQRNFIRNQIVPKLKSEINPALHSALFRSSVNIKNSSRLLNLLIEEKAGDYLEFVNNELIINSSFLAKFGKPLFDGLTRYGLKKYFDFEANFDDCMKLFGLLRNQTGKKILLSENLVAFKERDGLLIKRTAMENLPISVEIYAGEEGSFNNQTIKIESLSSDLLIRIGAKDSEIISGDNIDDIFILRRWKIGDKFIPLGMKGFKNVSDFLNDRKIPSNKKEEQLVLLNKNNIVWVVGYRIDERVKITKNTKKAYKLCLKN